MPLAQSALNHLGDHLMKMDFSQMLVFHRFYSQSHYIWEKLRFCKSVLEILKILITPAFTISLWQFKKRDQRETHTQKTIGTLIQKYIITFFKLQ